MQTEADFAFTFLRQLSARPVKYAADFTVPPSTLGPKPLLVWIYDILNLTCRFFHLLNVLNANAIIRRKPKEKVYTQFSLMLIQSVNIKFTSLKPPKIDINLMASPLQTFMALKTQVAEKLDLNPSLLRFLLKNKAISDSKSVHEVFGDATEAQIIVMVMKSANPSVASMATSSSQQGEEKMAVNNDDFWESIRLTITQKYKGTEDKEDVFAAFVKGYADKFGSTLQSPH